MSVGKKLAVVLLLATGVSAALFFRKDATPLEARQEAAEMANFRERVQRRVWVDSQWANSLPAPPQKSAQPLRIPAAMPAALPAAIGDPTATDRAPSFERTHSPVGALLGRIEQVPDEFGENRTGTLEAEFDEEDERPTVHLVADGDTLRQLAARYLGSADRFQELFEFNRDILASPDLLPIGTNLKIPPAEPLLETPALEPEAPVSATPEPENPRLENVPPRPISE